MKYSKLSLGISENRGNLGHVPFFLVLIYQIGLIQSTSLGNASVCDAGKYCTGGEILKCPVHTTSTANSSSISDCSCQIGYFAVTTGIECTQCDKGFNTTEFGSTTCKKIEDDSWSCFDHFWCFRRIVPAIVVLSVTVCIGIGYMICYCCKHTTNAVNSVATTLQRIQPYQYNPYKNRLQSPLLNYKMILTDTL